MNASKIKQLYESCDMSIKLQDASVVYCSEIYEDFTVCKARYFARKINDIDNWIGDQTSRPEPFDDKSAKVKIVFYGSAEKAKETCSELKGDAALVMRAPFSKNASASVSGRGNQARNLRSKSSQDINPTSSESISMIRALETKIEFLEARLVRFENSFTSFSDRLDNLIKEKDEDNDIEYIGSKSNHRIAEIASSIIEKKRLSKKFINQVKKWTHKDLSYDQIKQIKSTLLSGSTLASKVSIKLGTIIFGEEILRKALLGVNGEFTRKPRQFERKEIIPKEKEQILRDVLSLYDESVFTDGQGWNQIVRGPINQKGREMQLSLGDNKRRAKSPSPLLGKKPRLLSDDEDSRSSNTHDRFNNSNFEPLTQSIPHQEFELSEYEE